MALIAKRYTSELDEIKDNIRQSRLYWKKNIDTYRKFMRLVFKTAFSNDDVQKLSQLSKPALEFNILEAMISRLRGEFSKQEPSISVRAADGVPIDKLDEEFEATMKVIEDYIREIMATSTNDNMEYNIFSDLLGGGFSAAKVYTEYANELSFEQVIKMERVFDPKLVGFDPCARTSHKGDGEYCYEIAPWKKEDFEREFGEEATKKMSFSTGLEGFSWSYRNQEEEKVVLVADYYKKKKKKVRIVKLSDGHVINKKHYDDMVELWDSQGFIEQPPQIVEERDTVIETVCRYRICETELLEYTETDYKFLPIVFFDGNSVMMQDSEDAPNYQMCRPFVYHAAGVQKLKNYAGQTIAAEIQNMTMNKWVASVESIPEKYQEGWQNPQIEQVLLYNAFYKNNPEIQLMPPREVQRTPTPPLVQETFMGTDSTTQMILGSYDTVLGTNSNQLSGKAIQQGALQSNGASIPYLVGYIKGLNRIAEILLDLIPKYIVTPRTIPVRGLNGKRAYQLVNQKGDERSVDIQIDSSMLQIRVEAGVNSNIQKQAALEEITGMMQASPVFAEFINTMGLEIILDNMDIRGADHLKAQAAKFMQQVEAAKQQPPQPSETEIVVQAELELGKAKIESQMLIAQGEQANAAAKVAVDKQNADTNFMKVMALLKEQDAKLDLEQQKVDSENARTGIELALDIAEKHHSMSSSKKGTE